MRVLKAIRNLDKVVYGWAKQLLKVPLTEKEIDKLKICDTCPSAVDDEWFDLVNDEVELCKGQKCKECDCPLLVLVRTNKKCKLNKW